MELSSQCNEIIIDFSRNGKQWPIRNQISKMLQSIIAVSTTKTTSPGLFHVGTQLALRVRQVFGGIMKAFFGILAIFGIVSSANAADITLKSLKISSVAYQEGSWQIAITGNRPNVCTSPHAALVPGPGNTFALQVLGSSTADMCIQLMPGPYSIKADIRALVQKTGVKIDPNAVYTITGPNFSVTFNGSDITSYTRSMIQMEGILMEARNGQRALLTDNQKHLVLVDDSLIENSAELVNKHVLITGRLSQRNGVGIMAGIQPVMASQQRLKAVTISEL